MDIQEVHESISLIGEEYDELAYRMKQLEIRAGKELAAFTPSVKTRAVGQAETLEHLEVLQWELYYLKQMRGGESRNVLAAVPDTAITLNDMILQCTTVIDGYVDAPCADGASPMSTCPELALLIIFDVLRGSKATSLTQVCRRWRALLPNHARDMRWCGSVVRELTWSEMPPDRVAIHGVIRYHSLSTRDDMCSAVNGFIDPVHGWIYERGMTFLISTKPTEPFKYYTHTWAPTALGNKFMLTVQCGKFSIRSRVFNHRRKLHTWSQDDLCSAICPETDAVVMASTSTVTLWLYSETYVEGWSTDVGLKIETVAVNRHAVLALATATVVILSIITGAVLRRLPVGVVTDLTTLPMGFIWISAGSAYRLSVRDGHTSVVWQALPRHKYVSVCQFTEKIHLCREKRGTPLLYTTV
jgi:hypothetical protein